MNIKRLIRPNIIALSPFSSARDEFQGEADVYIDANESPYDNGTNRYPDSQHKLLKGKISAWRNIPTTQILLGNGSDELIDLLVRTFCVPGQDRISYHVPGFGMYKVVAGINDIEKREVLLKPDFEIDVDKSLEGTTANDKIFFICSPNNPTGNSPNAAHITKIVEQFPGIVVIDQAYVDFSEEESWLNKLDKYPNLVVLQTFSKALGAANLRIGMLFASEEIVHYVGKSQMPYNITTYSQQKGIEILEDWETQKNRIDEIVKNRKKMRPRLEALAVVEKVYPSDANFFLVKCKDAQKTKQHLLSKGIVVRDRSNLPLCENCLRFTIGTEEENDKVINALSELS